MKELEPQLAADRTCLGDSLIAAVQTAAAEMAGVAMLVNPRAGETHNSSPGARTIVIDLQSASIRRLAFSIPSRTATALAKRILADAPADHQANLVNDSLCEFANVVAGQAKALLAETPFAFSFSLPRLADAPELISPPAAHAIVLELDFQSEVGDLSVRAS